MLTRDKHRPSRAQAFVVRLLLVARVGWMRQLPHLKAAPFPSTSSPEVCSGGWKQRLAPRFPSAAGLSWPLISVAVGEGGWPTAAALSTLLLSQPASTSERSLRLLCWRLLEAVIMRNGSFAARVAKSASFLLQAGLLHRRSWALLPAQPAQQRSRRLLAGACGWW